jgi:hypothetical protein
MKPVSRPRGAKWAIPLLAAAVLGLGACAVDDGPYYGGDGGGYAGGYYEPYGYEMGGWGEGYHVGPGRRGDRGGDRGGAHDGRSPGGHAYRAAPAGRGAPSIPSQSRHR